MTPPFALCLYKNDIVKYINNFVNMLNKMLNKMRLVALFASADLI